MSKLLAAFAVFAAFISISSQSVAHQAPTQPPGGDGQNRRVVIANNSSIAVNNFYASPITSSNWEEDLLGDRTIAPGANIVATIDNGTTECHYDFKAVMINGREHERRNVNVCQVSRWTITDEGNSLE